MENNWKTWVVIMLSIAAGVGLFIYTLYLVDLANGRTEQKEEITIEIK
jgi:hypothetical protein